MKTDQIITMLKLQDCLNSRVNPDWRNAGNDWALAIMIECGELIDHIGWKWWKKQDMNLPQAQIELVDIWHFALSHLLESHKALPLEDAAHELYALAREHYFSDVTTTAKDLIQTTRYVASSAAAGYVTFSKILQLCHELDMTDDDLFRMYVGKAALNLFRYQNGYQDGSYIKMWHGEEDNVWLEKILVEEGLTDLDEILESLAVIYLTAKAGAQKADA